MLTMNTHYLHLATNLDTAIASIFCLSEAGSGYWLVPRLLKSSQSQKPFKLPEEGHVSLPAYSPSLTT